MLILMLGLSMVTVIVALHTATNEKKELAPVPVRVKK
jgi:hypothetical protein